MSTLNVQNNSFIMTFSYLDTVHFDHIYLISTPGLLSTSKYFTPPQLSFISSKLFLYYRFNLQYFCLSEPGLFCSFLQLHHLPESDTILFFILAPWYSIVRTCLVVLMRSSAGTYLSWVHNLTLMRNAIMNMAVRYL